MTWYIGKAKLALQMVGTLHTNSTWRGEGQGTLIGSVQHGRGCDTIHSTKSQVTWLRMTVDTRGEDLQGPSQYYYWAAMDKNPPLVEPSHNHTATGHEPRAHTGSYFSGCHQQEEQSCYRRQRSVCLPLVSVPASAERAHAHIHTQPREINKNTFTEQWLFVIDFNNITCCFLIISVDFSNNTPDHETLKVKQIRRRWFRTEVSTFPLQRAGQ